MTTVTPQPTASRHPYDTTSSIAVTGEILVDSLGQGSDP